MQVGHNRFSHRLAQLHTPLVEAINSPDCALNKHTVLVRRDHRTESVGLQAGSHDERRWTIARHHLVGYERIRGSIRAHLVGGAPEGQHSRLREGIRGEHVLHVKDRLQRLSEEDEVAGDDLGPLMKKLIEGMLPVRPWFTPVDRSCVVVDARTV